MGSVWIEREVVVRQRIPIRARVHAWSLVFTIAATAVGLSGCGAIKQDVHQYYRQMARNYQEAEEKAKLDVATLEAESRNFLQAGNVHKYNRSRKEVSRLKDWQDRCANQRQRFEKASQMFEHAPEKVTDPAQQPGTISDSPVLPAGGLNASSTAS